MAEDFCPLLSFGPFELDPRAGRLSRDGVEVALRPKAYSLLHHLVLSQGRLVSGQELLRSVWPNVVVEPAAIKNCIREIRATLQDDAREPRYIQTVHGRGYRFVAPVTGRGSDGSSSTYLILQRPGSLLVGRTRELRQLAAHHRRAMNGDRQVVFVTGEAGIGKTLLMECFLSACDGRVSSRVARGQCIDHFGSGEAYMPIVEALSDLGTRTGGQQVAQVVRRYAPTLLQRLPELLNSEECPPPGDHLSQVSGSRVLRDIATAIERLAANEPLILFLEDLHWSDPSTVELLAVLARRNTSAALLIVGTYRPETLDPCQHGLCRLKEELLLHDRCTEIRLGALSARDIRRFLRLRLAGHGLTQGQLHKLGSRLRARTSGNPLFLAKLTDHLLEDVGGQPGARRSALTYEAAAVMPENLRQFIQQQVSRLDAPVQQILQAASLAGQQFCATVLARPLNVDEAYIERVCDDLANRRHVLEATGVTEFGDGTIGQEYRFVHALYREAIAAKVPDAGRIRVHRKLAVRLEQLSGGDASGMATEIANHLEQGRLFDKAAQYLHTAGRNALRVGAHREASLHLRKGLELLRCLAETGRLSELELALRSDLSLAVAATRGWGSSEAGVAYERARALCERLGESQQLPPILWGVWAHLTLRSRHLEAKDIARRMIRLSNNGGSNSALLEGYLILGTSEMWLGEYARARPCLQKARGLYASGQHASHAYEYGQDPMAMALSFQGVCLWVCGFQDHAFACNRAALEAATLLEHAYTDAMVSVFAAVLCQMAARASEAETHAAHAIAVSIKHRFPLWLAMARILMGWAVGMQGHRDEGIALFERGLERWCSTGATWGVSYFPALLADVYLHYGWFERASRALSDASQGTRSTGECFYEPEIMRLQGEVWSRSLSAGAAGDREFQVAEEHLQRAAERARARGAPSFELRSRLTQYRLLALLGREQEAIGHLKQLCTRLTSCTGQELEMARALLRNG